MRWSRDAAGPPTSSKRSDVGRARVVTGKLKKSATISSRGRRSAAHATHSMGRLANCCGKGVDAQKKGRKRDHAHYSKKSKTFSQSYPAFFFFLLFPALCLYVPSAPLTRDLRVGPPARRCSARAKHKVNNSWLAFYPLTGFLFKACPPGYLLPPAFFPTTIPSPRYRCP